jgi:two-component system cell cycle sensor histidine kinase/response regulator CckA
MLFVQDLLDRGELVEGSASPELQNKKTVLVVDDDASVLKSVSGFLAGQYNVLTADNGKEALQLSKDFKHEIHLLLSDFQMPEMTGIALATKITLQRPNIKVLLMSGFTEGMLVLNEGWHFLAKPFIPSQLRALILGLVPSDAISRHNGGMASPAQGPVV